MAFLSSLSDLVEASNSFGLTERDRSDSGDTCACPTAAELSKAVSVSLGLDTLSSPISHMNQCSSSSAYPDCDLNAQGSALAATELGATRNMNSEGSARVMREANLGEGDFREVSHNTQQVSCMDLLRSGEVDSAQTLTRGPVFSRFARKESHLYMNQELPALTAQVDEFLPLKTYPAYSANADLYRDSSAALGEFSRQVEAERGGSDGQNMCKYCNCGQTSLASRHECHCYWYRRGEQGRKCGTRAAMAPEYGQVESYQSAAPQGHGTFSAIKTEPSVWVDCTDFR